MGLSGLFRWNNNDDAHSNPIFCNIPLGSRDFSRLMESTIIAHREKSLHHMLNEYLINECPASTTSEAGDHYHCFPVAAIRICHSLLSSCCVCMAARVRERQNPQLLPTSP